MHDPPCSLRVFQFSLALTCPRLSPPNYTPSPLPKGKNRQRLPKSARGQPSYSRTQEAKLLQREKSTKCRAPNAHNDTRECENRGRKAIRQTRVSFCEKNKKNCLENSDSASYAVGHPREAVLGQDPFTNYMGSTHTKAPSSFLHPPPTSRCV
ncbi:hypothetical protein TGARI_368140 [Toxoplasma gondii ARI]|uniref:Uncharacterized protein n=1 Tax=Toxoplasma gondii ARI TaxID=1074872 RepID=A0A139YA64_TOXGO|nr:hypothetical protein TGARI_368140 [Toxoplasma gondii ARI]